MKIGILSDSHNEIKRTRQAVQLLVEEGAELLIHCGDLACPEIVAECSVRPFYFVFGNHDSDMTMDLKEAATEHGATCLEWGGAIDVAGKSIAVVHGHMTMDLQPLLKANPNYLFSGHSHIAADWQEGETRRINPGALYRADEYSVALLNLVTDELKFLTVRKVWI